ncbi:ISAzo13 family transposase [bacterium]|nr:ISAzo13 family transposase [bacterium]
MRNLYRSLNEKERRRYAAAEADKLGHGGVAYVARVVGCDPDTIRHGRRELDQLGDEDPVGDRIRRPGAGRPVTEVKHPEVVEELQRSLEHRTAGDPMREGVLWTDLSPRQLAGQIADETGTQVSQRIVQRMLRNLKVGLRQMAKVLPGGESPDRDTQFLHMGTLINQYLADGLPVISMDTKKKEFLGTLYRQGRVYTSQAFQVFDHDFPSWSSGVVIPHGLYDVGRNEGWLHPGLSRDTSEFACDSLRLWLEHDAWRLSPDFRELLLICDGGGSNGCRTHIFKQDLQELVDEFGIEIRVAHFPAYCSKYNPIERRLFSHVTRACQGVLFDSLQTVKSLMSRTSTRTGLQVTVRVLEKIYETGRKASEAFKNNMPIDFDNILPRYNYTLSPQMPK